MQVDLANCWVEDGKPHKGLVLEDSENPRKIICQSHKDRRRETAAKTAAPTSKEVRRCSVNDPGNHGGHLETINDRLVCKNHGDEIWEDEGLQDKYDRMVDSYR